MASSTLSFWRVTQARVLPCCRGGGARRYTTGSSTAVFARDTIYALGSGAGKAAVAVVRISGGHAGAAARAVLPTGVPEGGRLALRRIVDPRDRSLIDMGMAVFFRGPRSATGEDVAELHVHGSRAVVSKLLDALGSLPGLRPAAAGEFTRRAFTCGKLDLAAAEGLADLLNADTDAQRRLALQGMTGEASRRYDEWRAELIAISASLEASIDFVDDVDVAEAGGSSGVVGKVRAHCLHVLASIERHLETGRRAETIRSGVSVGIFGAVNAGKSSLLNTLLRRPAAIVSSLPGTTRDVLEVTMDLGGVPVVLADTAGLREEAQASDEVEREGIRRAVQRVSNAQLRLCVIDAPALVRRLQLTAHSASRAPWHWQTDRELDYLRLVTADDTILVLNKTEDGDPAAAADALQSWFPGNTVVPVSCVRNHGIDALLGILEAFVHERYGLSEGEHGTAAAREPMLLRDRHRQHLERCAAALRAMLNNDHSLDLAAEEVRIAIRELAAITGRVDVEDVLDELFATFCIGK